VISVAERSARRHLDESAFSRELRAFLDERAPGRVAAGERAATARAWAETLVDEGWAAPGWPVEHGGLDLPPVLQAVYHEEMTRARAPRHPCPVSFIVGPTLIVHGTDAQRAQHLDDLLRGRTVWCQGFSEPEAGSDLASIRTRARRDGDRYVLDGQKVWTTRADEADWMFALVRTGGDGPGGITYVLVSMATPGVSVRPLRDLTGAAHFSEVFFDGVEVPTENVVGEQGGGWAIARTSLGHERATAFIAQEYRYRRIVTELAELARERGRAGEPEIRQQLAGFESDVRILGALGQRNLAEVVATGSPGPESSVSRLAGSLFEQRLHEAAVNLLGPHGQLAVEDRHAPQRGRWVHGFLRTRASTIGAGTAEIQRNTIAERVLGLPREPAGRPHEEPSP